MNIKILAFSAIIFLQSCMTDKSTTNPISNFRESIPTQMECSDSTYNGTYSSDKGYLYVCDNFLRLNDSSYNIKISNDGFNKGQLDFIIDDPNLLPPLNRFRYPYSSSILMDNDTLYMIQTQSKNNWIKWVKYAD